MLNKIIEISIKNKLIVGLFILSLIGYGSYQTALLPIDAVPDITNNQVQVITIAPALGANDIERLITFPIEQVNNNLPNLKEIRSFSSFGLSVITIVFEDNVDIYLARQQIAERLQQVQEELPKSFGSPFLAPVTTGLGEIYQYVVRPEKGFEHKYSVMELRTIQDWIVRKQLLGVKGVAEVSSFGGLLKQYEVAVDFNKLLSYNITINDVFTALESNNKNTGGSYIEKGPTALFIRTEGLINNLEDIKNISIKNLPNGIPLLIRDVAEVNFGHATRYGALTYNGNQQVSGAVVLMLKGQNSNEVIKNVKARIEMIKKSLPKGVIIEPFIDRTKMVNNAINTVTKNLLEGALIVIFVLVLFLGNFRAGLLVASVIPLSMLFAIIMMNFFGVSGNLMSLGALDFGLIIDGAVIIVEATMHKLVNKSKFNKVAQLSQNEMDNEVVFSASKMMNSAVFGQIIILIVYLPIFTLQGIEGKMFKPMAQTVAFALIGAFILSLTYIPMMSTLILSKKISHKITFSDKMMNRLEYYYQKALFKAIRYQKIIIASVFTFLGLAIIVMSKLGGEFIPALPEGDFAVETRVLSGSNLKTSIEAVSKASKILIEKFPEVERIVAKTGSGEVPTDPMPIDASDMIIVLKKRSEWTSAKTYAELESKMIESLKEISGVKFSFQYPVAMRFNELISGAKQDVVCKIFGENLDTLAHYANILGKICGTVKGNSGVYVETVSGLPQIIILYKREAIAQYKLNIDHVNSIINTAFAGKVSGKVYEGEKRFDLVVRLKADNRQQLNNVSNLLIPTPDGTQIPLSTVANVEIVEGPNQIQRENGQRRIIVGFNVRGRDVQTMVEELQQKVSEKIKLPPGNYITYGGAFENLNEAKQRLYIAVPISLILIFLLLYFAFGSIKQGLLIYTAIPLSAIGGILALALRDISFSISAGIGFIALFGVAVLNGIVLIAEFNRFKAEGFSNVKRIVIQGTILRLRPVLMTAFVASLGFLPMAISTGEGAEVQRPLATVVIGGLLIATLLTLFLLPILYILANPIKNMNKKSISALLVIVFLMVNNVNAQISITLNQAINIALKNNLSLKNENLKSEYQQKLIKSGISIPFTNVFGEIGQINSYYNDKRIGMVQSINFPTVYSNQKSLLKEEWKSSLLNAGIKEAMLKKQVTQLFYELVYMQKKKELLQKNDSLYSEFLNKSKLRFNKGESNILENITAENQQGQIAVQLLQLQYDWEILQLQFQLLLNSDTVYNPSIENNGEMIIEILDKIDLASHPAMQFFSQQKQIAKASIKLEKSKLAPGINLGYNIMSMRGVGADGINYNNTIQFQSAQLGVAIPVFSLGQRAKINAAKTQETIASIENNLQKKNFENQYKTAYAQYQKFEESVQYFEKTALKNADLISATAKEQYINGDINYLEWVILNNQSITIKSNYIEAVKNRNNAIAEINYYLNK